MIDYRQFLTEFSDKDYKKKVIRNFAKYLEDNTGTTYNSTTDKYENDKIWWTVGNGNGAYKDERLTVGTKSSTVDENNFKTLVFMVDDDFNLVAYLDAEENELLNNTELLTKAPDASGEKAYAKWFVSGSAAGNERAFAGALKVINQFFTDDSLQTTTVDDARAGYTDADNARLQKQIASNGDYVYLTWNKSDELQLQDLKSRASALRKAMKLMKDQMDDITAVVTDPTSSEEEVADAKKQQTQIAKQWFDSKEQLDKLKLDIKDFEEDKVKYLKFKNSGERSHINDREKQELRAINSRELQNLAARNDVVFSNDDLKSISDDKMQQMIDQLKGGAETFAPNTKTRKPRKIKTGDVKDSRAAKAAADAKAAKAAKKKDDEDFLAALRSLMS